MRDPRKYRAVFLTLPAALAFTAGCGDDGAAGPEPGAQVEDAVENDTINDDEYGVYQADELKEFEDRAQAGRVVTVHAYVIRIVQPGNAFVVGQDIADPGLLVIMPPKLTDAPALEEGMSLLVVGTVVNFDAANLESDYPGLELDDDEYAGRHDETALVARTIMEAPSHLTRIRAFI